MQPDSAEKRWTLLSNHGAALLHLVSHPDATLRDVAAAIGVTDRAAATFVTDLRAEGYLVARRVGRRNTYEVNLQGLLRDEVVSHRTVADLLDGLVAPNAYRAAKHLPSDTPRPHDVRESPRSRPEGLRRYLDS